MRASLVDRPIRLGAVLIGARGGSRGSQLAHTVRGCRERWVSNTAREPRWSDQAPRFATMRLHRLGALLKSEIAKENWVRSANLLS
jgi:hypothetical protein